MPRPRLSLSLLGALLLGCSADPASLVSPEPIDIPCAPTQTSPYASGIPYLGIHADAGNSDVVRCRTGAAFTPVWHALQGLGLTQPNTFSPDGQTTYATTTHPAPDGCRLHAVDVDSGQVRWCRSYAGSIARSAVEVDADGALYFTVGASMISTDAEGTERWRTDFEGKQGQSDAPWGLHFTPQGHVATVTSSGIVYLISRDDGRALASLSIADVYGFVPPATLGDGIDVTSLMPDEVQANIEAVWGVDPAAEDGPSFASFLGTGAFVDNTLAVASDSSLYIIGGGPDESTGALVQLRVEGTADAPTLAPGWYSPTHFGSATSPSISPGDRYVMISDGASGQNALEPDGIDARVKVMDIVACDANQDSDADPNRCGVAYEQRLERGAVPGSPAIDGDGTVVFYEFGMAFDWAADARDLVSFGPDGLHWEVTLSDDRDWMSVITVSDNHLIGTATAVEGAGVSLGGLQYPIRSHDTLVVLDRDDGSEVFSAPIADDSAATVTIGPNGELYVGMLGLISILSLQEQPTLGLMRFSATAVAE